MSKKYYGGISIQNSQELGFFDSDSSNFLAFKAPAALTGNTTLTLPDGDSTGTQALVSNGSGVLSWASFLSATLTDSYIFVGNGSNVATGVAVSGDISIGNDGTTAIASGVIVDGDVNASAGITLSKLAATTASRALVSDGSGFISASAVTATELGYVSGVTSAIQTQINNLSTLINGLEWQDSAKDYITDNTATPPTEVSGDRYVLSHDGGSPNAAWDGASAGDIVEFNGSVWTAVTPTTGMFISVDDEASLLYYWGGTTWSTKSFEATTASTGLTKVGLDIQLASSSAGAGLGFSTGVLSVNVDDSGIEIATDTLQLKDAGVTNAKVATGIDAAKLADGSVSNTEFQYINSLTSNAQTQLNSKTTKASTTWVNGDTATKAFAHNLNTTDVHVQLFDIDSGETIEVDSVVRTDANTVTCTASSAPSGGGSGWRIVVIG